MHVLMKKTIFTIISGLEKQNIFFSDRLRRKEFILYLEQMRRIVLRWFF